MPSKFITFEVYRKALGGYPYIKKGVLLSEEDIAGTIKFFISKKIEDNNPMFWYIDNEITALKKACGTVIDYTLIDKKISSLDNVFEKNTKWNLIIRTVPSQSIGST